MIEVCISEEFKKECPDFCVAIIEADVVNSENSDELWNRIHEAEKEFRGKYTTETLKQQSGIAATRAAYRRFGKDPSRYRPSNEALVRRVLQGKELYHINTLVDINNLASIHWGYSIGGFDMNKIQGHRLVLGVGEKDEPYEGIGRGVLNIEGLPVYRDNKGGIGTPTSDHERTKIGMDIRQLLFLINGYDGDEERTLACAKELQDLLREFGGSDGGTIRLVRANETAE